MNGLLIYSGGLDSTTLLYEYRDSIKLAISFNYGSRQFPMEVDFAIWHCKKLNIPHKTIKLDFFKEFNRFKDVPEVFNGEYEDKSMRKMFVPLRNGIFLAVGAGLAEDVKLDCVYVGIHTKGPRPVYPDNTTKFIQWMNLASQEGTYRHIEVISPYQNKNKREIALIGHALKIDYSKTWSCYKGLRHQCGTCSACLERKEGLRGFDNTKYMEE